MKPLFDLVALNTAKAINLYRVGGVIGILLGITTSILVSQTRRLEASDLVARYRLGRR